MARYDIGGMLARSGQAQGQQIASGFEQFGTGLGSMLTGIGTGLASRRERKEQEAAAQEAQALLQQYANDPAQLNALGQKYATEGNDALSKLFLDAAKTANQRQVAVLEEAGAQITATTEAARKKGQLRDALMAAREREDTNAVRALSNRSMDPSEYLNSLATKTEDNYKVVGNRIFDTSTGEYVEPKTVADLLPLSALKDAVTPESLVEYAKTGDKTVLQAKEEDEVSKDIVAQLSATDTVLETVDKALGLTDDYWVAGYDIAKILPLPTDAKQMESYVKTLKANLAFDRLQKMRNDSKTGGALGQVSNIELDLLQSSVAALDPGSKNFKEQLATVRRQYENFRNSLLGQEPNDPKYIKDPDTGKLYYKLGNDYIDLEEASKTNRFNLSPDPRTGGEF